MPFVAMLVALTLLPTAASAQISQRSDPSDALSRAAEDLAAASAQTTQPAEGSAPASEVSDAPEAVASPQATVGTFIDAMQRIDEGRGDVDQAWTDVRFVMESGDLSEAQVIAASRALVEVLRKVGLPAEGLPDARSIGDQTRYVLFPRPSAHGTVWDRLEQRGASQYPRGEIALERVGERGWRFTHETLRRAPALAEALAPLKPTHLEETDAVPVDATGALLDRLGPTFTRTSWWAWGALLIAIFVGLGAGRLVQWLLRRAADRMRRGQRIVRATVLDDLAAPVSLAALTLGLTVGLLFIHMDPRGVRPFMQDVLLLLYILALAWFLYNLVDVVELGLRRMTQRSASKLDDTIVPLVRKTLRVFIVIVFTLFIAQNIFGLNITGWLAGLGIVGLVVSLAAQDSVKNLFGSMMVFFDKPFSIGDWVIFDQYEGYIEEIGFRSTRLRLWSRHQVTIPNMHFNAGNVTNVARRPLDRRVMDITVTYDTPPEKIQQATQILEEILREPDIAAPFDFENYPPHIGFVEFNSASLCIRVYYYFMLKDGRNYWDYFNHRHLVNMRILQRFNEAGIDFAFPTQTLHLAGDPKRQLAVRLLESDGRGGQGNAPVSGDGA